MTKNALFVSVLSFLLLSSAAFAGALHEATQAGDRQRVNELLGQGAAIDEPDEGGDTPLIVAALNGRADVARLLLDKGANLQVGNARGLTPLHAAAYAGQVDVARLLIEKGAKIDQSDNFYQMAPLHAAAEENQKPIVELLLANGANVDAQERNGYTPLTQAGWREHWDVATMLMKAGAVCQPAELVGNWLYEECTKRD